MVISGPVNFPLLHVANPDKIQWHSLKYMYWIVVQISKLFFPW